MKLKSIKNLVVGVDLSPYSKKVVQEARGLAAKMKVPVTYVFVAQDVLVMDGTFQVDRLEMDEYHEKNVRKNYRLSNKENVVIVYGDPDKALIAVAKKITNPMIVVGHRGFNKILKFFLGSTAEGLIFNSPYPVWVHRGEKSVLPKKILVPSDLSARSRKTYDSLENFRKIFKSNTEMYHVVLEPLRVIEHGMYTFMYNQIELDNLERVKKFKKEFPKLKTEKAIGDITYRLNQHAKKFDVIALTPRHHKGSTSPVGSLTSKLLRTSDKPILVVPA